MENVIHITKATLPRRTPTVRAGVHKVKVCIHRYKGHMRFRVNVQNRYGAFVYMSLNKFKFEEDIDAIIEKYRESLKKG